MTFGKDYARAYDAFYKSKDYSAESHFTCERLAQILGDGTFDILDIGCGTGLHDVELVRAGHSVTGTDKSDEMLARAEQRRLALPHPLRDKLRFVQGDARDLRTGSTYDAVISLFHVMSYMSGDGDFAAALATIRAHLKQHGALLFDFWHGPAITANPPQHREREVTEDGKHIRRVTTPRWDKARHAVAIVFDVTETDLATGQSRNSSEEHLMRYFFEEELTRALHDSGFAIVEAGEWLTTAKPTEKTFGVYVLAKAI